MEREGFSQAFESPACQADYEAYLSGHSAEETHAWMKAHRGCFHEWTGFAWIAFSQADTKTAEIAWRQQLHVGDQRLLGACGDHECEVAAVAAELARAETVEIGAATKAHTEAFLDEVALNQKYADRMTKAYGAVEGICLYHLSVECISALRQAFDWMYPRMYDAEGDVGIEHFTYSMLPFYREVFEDTLTQRYAARWAARLLDAVESGEFRNPRGMPALFAMGRAAFAGDEDRFWKFMIVYATRGAGWATAHRMVTDENRPVFLAQMVISAAMGVIDTAWAAAGAAWSYAGDKDSTCFQPKPYHFWMAGGFAYLLRKEGYSARTSELVARLTGALYEVASDTVGRDPDEVFFLPPFDQKVSRQRRELTHHYLGAQFGLDTTAALDFDATLGRFMEASQPLPSMSEEDMREAIATPATRWRLWTRLTGYYLRP